MRKSIEVAGIQIILSIVLTMIIGGLAILVNDQIRGIYWIVAMILSVLLSYWLLPKESKIKNMLIANILFLLVTFIVIFMSGKIYDTSWDGQTYHKEAVIVLKEGWNPVYDEERPKYKSDETIDNNINLWVNHYAKGNWYFGAALYDLFDNIKLAKTYNPLLLISLLFISYSFFAKRTKWHWSALLVLAITFNPITVSQILTNYNDGEIGVLITLMVLTVIRYLEEKDKKAYAIVGLLLITMASVKFTALAYAMLIAATPFALVIYKHFSEDKNINIKELIVKLIKMKELRTYVIAILVGVVLVGAGSYVKNTIDHGHPFYPLSGEGKVDIMSYNTPLAIEGKPLYEQFYISIFGEMTNDRTIEDIPIKFPLTIEEDEEKYLSYTDLRIGGFGPYFGFVVMMTLFAIVAWSKTIFRKENLVELTIIVLILVSIVINPELWWARYIPQLWLIPILVVYMILKDRNKKQMVVSFVVLMVMILNSTHMLNATLEKNYIETNILNEQMKMLREYEGEIGVKYQTMRTTREVFKQNSVEVKEVDVCKNKIYLKSTTTIVCIDDEDDYKKMKVKNEFIKEKFERKEEKEES